MFWNHCHFAFVGVRACVCRVRVCVLFRRLIVFVLLVRGCSSVWCCRDVFVWGLCLFLWLGWFVFVQFVCMLPPPTLPVASPSRLRACLPACLALRRLRPSPCVQSERSRFCVQVRVLVLKLLYAELTRAVFWIPFFKGAPGAITAAPEPAPHCP